MIARLQSMAPLRTATQSARSRAQHVPLAETAQNKRHQGRWLRHSQDDYGETHERDIAEQRAPCWRKPAARPIEQRDPKSQYQQEKPEDRHDGGVIPGLSWATPCTQYARAGARPQSVGRAPNTACGGQTRALSRSARVLGKEDLSGVAKLSSMVHHRCSTIVAFSTSVQPLSSREISGTRTTK